MKHVKDLLYFSCKTVDEISSKLKITEPLTWLTDFYTYSNKIF